MFRFLYKIFTPCRVGLPGGAGGRHTAAPGGHPGALPVCVCVSVSVCECECVCVCVFV
jgi:hypothetical protein